MERKNTLLVFMLASVFVLAGFSTILNEKAYAQLAPPFGDFTCWSLVLNTTNNLSSNIVIQDQFGNIDHPDQWIQVEYCTAAEKNNIASPFSPDLKQHYQGWEYDGPAFSPGTGQTVLLEVPQFQNFETVLGELDEILVPAVKFLEFPTQDPNQIIQSVDSEQHWNCYNITGPTVDELVNLETQHGVINGVTVVDPFLLCSPILKFVGADVFPASGELIDEHMVCYNIYKTEVPPSVLPAALADQLTLASRNDAVPTEINLLEKLCVPAFKSFPIVGGSMVPIDTSALLLAGAQSISMWMIPVVVAGVGIGIGVFVIKRRN